MLNIKSKFHFFRKNNINYLDSASTTQVPDIVMRAVSESLMYKGNPGRSSHVTARKNEQLINDARSSIARFINAESEELVFTNNTTDGVNTMVNAISHIFSPGDEILVGISEHHSNLLPYVRLAKDQGLNIRLIDLQNGAITLDAIKEKTSYRTKLIAIAHISNVLGVINNVEMIGTYLKENYPQCIYVVDGTQAVAHIPVDIKKVKSDFYVFSGHKMYGPDGIGVLYVQKNKHHNLKPVRSGGGAVKNIAITRQSDLDIISPEYFQDLSILEGGTPNTANILGLAKAAGFINKIGFDSIRSHEIKLSNTLLSKLEAISEIQLYPKNTPLERIGVISFSLKNYSTKELSEYLDSQNICVRYGSHCAFPLSEELGSETLRISLGIYSNEEDIDQIIDQITFFINKKKGLIKNENLEKLRSHVYYKNSHIVNSFSSIITRIEQSLYGVGDTEIIVMGGHFLAIPDYKNNTFHPGIQGMLTEDLYPMLSEFGMTSFPIFSWNMACRIVSHLQSKGYNAKLSIIANDTTGINELRLSDSNINNKTAETYRNELLDIFQDNKGIPDEYLKILKKYNLKLKDIIKDASRYYFRETNLRSNFKKFINKNKKYFRDVIDYKIDRKDADISINILDNQHIKTCTFDTFQSKTGGKFCIAELTQFIAELFGKSKDVDFKYLSERINKPKSKAKHQVLIAFTPAMCNNAVIRAGELYTKLFLQEQGHGSFKFFNIPLGPDAERNLATGTEMTYISDKDNLEIIEVENEPSFIELWKLNEDNLLYDRNLYVEEIENLFKEKGINKNSKILDTCVGPGFLSYDLLKSGYNVSTTDKNIDNVIPFYNDLKESNIKHTSVITEWLDLGKNFESNSFDMMFNRGNAFIYANGGWNESTSINGNKTLSVMEETLEIYFDLLKPGGYLYIDKFKDSEIPDKKVAGRLQIESSNEEKDIVFYVERKPDEKIRYAQMLLRDKDGNEEGIPNVAYDLSEFEMENLLRKVGFRYEKITIKSEKHFTVWLAQKPI